MFQDKYVFSQLTAFLNRTQFNNYVRKYDGNRYVKHFTCWNQMLAMMFGQLSNRESLRDLIVAFEAHRGKQYHLGLGREPIAKTNLKYKTVRWKRRMPKNIMTDAEVKLTGYLSEKKYPESFRLVRYYDEEDDREFTFLTNAKQLSALDVANLYKKRWLIELFFKWLKQHLKIKKFWGQTENAVRIQIYTAVTAYCMMAIVQKKMDVQRSIYEMLQLVSVSLTDTVELKTLFCKPNCNIVNELDGSTEPTLF